VVVLAWVAVFLALCIGGGIFVVRSDRKRAARLAIGDRTELPPGTPVDVFVDPEAATRIATRAVQQVGGHNVTVLKDGSAVGWIGSSLTNIPTKAEYVVAVARIVQPDGSIVLACSSQPRFSTMAFGGRRSADLTRQLVAEVTNLASNSTF
jgi:hypothetical protein